ncbi:alpha-ketoacid dehydrogenase subunit beta [Chloroflexota bacterium]
MNTFLNSINSALKMAMTKDKRVILLGEDLLDPYGGAFKVSQGLSTLFPDQVITTPISEAAIVGIATGMAMRGLRPIVEIMFGDFLTLTADQIINHASKFHWMYNSKVDVPLVIRAPMGGRRGYGPTHSQSIEKLFFGVPGLRVIAPNTMGDPGYLLISAIEDKNPVLFIEHKLLYASRLQGPNSEDLVDAKVLIIGNGYPTHKIQFSSTPEVTIATYGYNFEIARKAAVEVLYEYEINTEIVLFSQISPLNLDPLLESINLTGKLITFEEGYLTSGWGSEIAGRISETNVENLNIIRIGAKDFPIPNSNALEKLVLPSKELLKERIVEIYHR